MRTMRTTVQVPAGEGEQKSGQSCELLRQIIRSASQSVTVLCQSHFPKKSAVSHPGFFSDIAENAKWVP
jgi:hypothetical protein